MLEVNNNENTMLDVLDKIESFTIYKNGEKTEIFKSNKKFNSIFNKLQKVFDKGQIFPAFGVSLHNETQHALKKDQWLQINFKDQITKNGLPFNALLIRLNSVYGIDLIRLYDGKYEGRCIHLYFFEEIKLCDIID